MGREARECRANWQGLYRKISLRGQRRAGCRYFANLRKSHYNPYPGQSGVASSTPKYQTPPAPNSFPAQPEAPASPYEFGSSKKVTPSSSHTTTPKKATASSTKKKGTSSKSAAKTTAKKSAKPKYTVGKGDTLSSIARKKGSSVAKIKAANGLSSDLIRPGQSLKIP